MERTGSIFSKRKIWGLGFLTEKKLAIFVAVGTDPQPFDRLLKAVDELIGQKILAGDVFCQTGYSTYRPKNAAWESFLNPIVFNQKIREADLVILHGGAGAIGTALQCHTPCIVMPRLFKFREHANDHQLELVRHLEKNGFILMADSPKELEKMVKKARVWKPLGYEGGKKIVGLLDSFVKNVF